MQIVSLLLVAYLMGSIPFGKLYGLYFKGIDIQQHGTGNIGFANACRVLGFRLGVLVLFSDIAKSFVPLLLAKIYLDCPQTVLLLMGLAAIVGHAYPIWLDYKGGKSVATGFGALLVIAPVIALCGVTVYCLTFMIVRKSAVGSVCASWSLPFWAAMLNPSLLPYCLLLALFATYTHRTNIKQLIAQYAS